MMDRTETLRMLATLHASERWTELRARALEAAKAFPDVADICAFVAHAMRQLGELEPGYAWAVRGLAIDPENLFARNRVSLLANLTKRFEEAWASALPILDRVPGTAGDAQNIAVTLSNALHAAIPLGRAALAVALFAPAIERLDHGDLHFNAACLYALVRDDRVFVYMRKSLASGKAKGAFTDGDFDSVRADPRFVALLVRDWDAERAALERASKRSRDDLVPEDFLAEVPAGVIDHERHAELEAAIDAAVDDPVGYAVYADWLLGQSNVRGELILASRRCAEATGEDERMLAFVAWADHVHEHGGTYLGAFAPHHGATRWYQGFVRELVFAPRRGSRAGMLAATLSAPVCRFVQAVAIGSLRVDDYTPLLDVVVDAELRHLRTLAIVTDEVMTRIEVQGLALPHVTSLSVRAGVLELGVLDLPCLERLALGAIEPDHVATILASPLPRLAHLALGGVTEAAVRSLVDHARFLWHLDLDLRDNDFDAAAEAELRRALPNARL